jgi:hypothetical protein
MLFHPWTKVERVFRVFLIRNTQSEKLSVFRPEMKARCGFNHRDSFLNLNILGSVKRAKALTLKHWDGYTGASLGSKCLPYIIRYAGTPRNQGLKPLNA